MKLLSLLKKTALRLGILSLTLGFFLPTAWGYRLEEYTLPDPDSLPNGITLGPDGNIWFVEIGATQDAVAWISPDGQEVMEFPTLTPLSGPEQITTGPDGNIWFTEWDANQVGRISPDGTNQQEFLTPTQPSNPAGILTASDGNVWFADEDNNFLSMITLDGMIMEYLVPTANSRPFYMCNGPDGNIWFVEFGASQVGRFNPVSKVFDEYPTLTPDGGLNDIAAGSDGNLWFTEGNNNLIGRISPDGTSMEEFPIPTADSSPFGILGGADGNIWFSEFDGNNIGVMNTSGNILMEIPVPTADSWPLDLTLDSVGNVWFTERNVNKIGKIIFALFQIEATDFTLLPETTTFSFQVTRNQDTTHEDTVEVFTMDGSAVAGVDYVALDTMLTFSPGETSKNLSIQLLNNPNVDQDRTFSINFRNPSFGVLLGANQTVTLAAPGGGCGLSGSSHHSPSTYVLVLSLLFGFYLVWRKNSNGDRTSL